ncbi:hypothetical protein C2E23DRAFT_880347 [Lenzites betulinus]|nr:hypothetical protein C2E23DRAFT_880347 [Lenzites betulinus]
MPPPPKRSSRAQHTQNVSKSASPKKSSAKATAVTPVQSRKPSLKRKLSPDPHLYAERLEDHSDLEGSTFVSKTSRRSSLAKKIRFSSPESDLTPLPSTSGFDTDPEELVPTSQSDEQELTLPRDHGHELDPAVVKESVARWCQETDASPPSRAQSPPRLDPLHIPSELPMEHPPAHDALVSNLSVHATPIRTPVRQVLAPVASPSDAFSSLTPPPSSDSTSSPELEEELQVVQALDVKSKTEQLIADIKARAFAAAHSSPEQSPVDLDDLSDSDSDSDSDEDAGFAAMLTKGVKGKERATVMDRSSKAGLPRPEPSSAPRYNLRRISPKAPKALPSLITQQRKPSKASPLDALLREKVREERTGSDMATIRRAEAAFAAAKEKEDAKKNLKDEMDGEEGSETDDDWRAAIGLLGAATRGSSKSQSKQNTNAKARSVEPDGHGGDGDDEIDSEPVLVAKRVNAVGDILERDRLDEKARALATLVAEPAGVPLWVEAADDMDIDCRLPLFTADTGANAILQLLENATRSDDAMQVSALLASGFIAVLQPEHYASVVPWLFNAVFLDGHSLSNLAYTQLMRLGPLLGSYRSGLEPSSIYSALVRLGAPRSVLVDKYGWDVPSTQTSKFAFVAEQRDDMVYRLVTLLGALANVSAGAGLCNYFLVTLLVGMDPSASEELLAAVHQSCDSIAQAIAALDNGSFDVEASLCGMIVAFGMTISPLNQSRLISLFPCISPSTTRMARNVARSLLTGGSTSPRTYEKLPSLAPIVELLAPPVGSLQHFDVMGNADKEGYHDDLACRVSLLSLVLSDIDEYTLLEVQAAKSKATRENGRLAQEDTEKTEKDEDQSSVIEQVRMQLELLHGRIVDTRAAHLDRSRVKAALQRLNLRVHYQRVATLKSGKPRTLRGYLVKPS